MSMNAPVLNDATTQILVPVYNEGSNVLELSKRLKEAGVAFDRLTFIYDMETDSSLPYVRELERQDSRVKALRNQIGPGVLNALVSGFSQVDAGPVIVLMGDNSDKLGIIPQMISLWSSGAVIVSPSRYMKGGKQHGGGLIKSTLSRLAGTSLAFLGFPTADPTNNFKLYDGSWLRTQRIESSGGFEVALELCVKAYKQGLEIKELPTEWYDRTVGQSRFKIMAWLPRYLFWYLRGIKAIAAHGGWRFG